MTKFLIPAALVAAVAIVTAPAAGASPDETKCGKRGGASACQKPGHSSLHTAPKTLPNTLPGGLVRPGWIPGYGGSPFPVVD